MDRFDRIYRLHGILINNKRTPLSLKQIMEHLECSKATAKRTIESYRNYLFAPLIYDQESKGYRLEADGKAVYELPGLWFNDSELFALLVSHRLLTDIQPGLLQEKIQPVRQRIEEILANKKIGGGDLDKCIRILQMSHRPIDLEKYRMIASAAVQQRQLKILYHGRARDKITERKISPQRIVYYRDNWYLDGWCHLRESLRTFSIDRIQPIKLLNEEAILMSEQQLDKLLTDSYGIFAGQPTQTAHLRFTPQAAKWVADEQWHPQQKIDIDLHGNMQLQVPYQNPTELIRDILKFAEEVEVIAPASLRQMVAKKLQNAARQYKK